MNGERRPQQPPDFEAVCDGVDRVLELVRTRLPATQGPAIRDWNDRLFLEAFKRGYRCLRSIRELAGRLEAEDATVLTRALVSLTLQYLWLVSTDEAEERRDRLRRLELKWATDRATLGEELLDLGYLPGDSSEQVKPFRAKADQLERECVRRLPSEKDLAIRLDRDIASDEPRFFEIVYARIYRTSSHVAHYGIGAALAGYVNNPEANAEAHSLERLDRDGAADALGLALVTYAALLDFAEPVIRHGLTHEIEEIVKTAFGH